MNALKFMCACNFVLLANDEDGKEHTLAFSLTKKRIIAALKDGVFGSGLFRIKSKKTGKVTEYYYSNRLWEITDNGDFRKI